MFDEDMYMFYICFVLLVALHVAVQNGQLATCRVLLTETSIEAEAVNLKYVL